MRWSRTKELPTRRRRRKSARNMFVFPRIKHFMFMLLLLSLLLLLWFLLLLRSRTCIWEAANRRHRDRGSSSAAGLRWNWPRPEEFKLCALLVLVCSAERPSRRLNWRGSSTYVFRSSSSLSTHLFRFRLRSKCALAIVVAPFAVITTASSGAAAATRCVTVRTECYGLAKISSGDFNIHFICLF